MSLEARPKAWAWARLASALNEEKIPDLEEQDLIHTRAPRGRTSFVRSYGQRCFLKLPVRAPPPAPLFSRPPSTLTACLFPRNPLRLPALYDPKRQIMSTSDRSPPIKPSILISHPPNPPPLLTAHRDHQPAPC